MNRPLNEHEIAYVFEHMDLMMDTSMWKKDFRYEAARKFKNQIAVVPHSEGISVATINNLPILFTSDHPDAYSIDTNGNLIFHHDLLKSTFYLLSCYDEHFVNKSRDHWGRVMYKDSIQKQLDIIHRPVVNEYFNLILEGVNAFRKHHQKPQIAKRKLFESYGFLLSHDIDVIDKYGWPHLGFKIKELLGLAKTNHSKWKILKATFQSAIQFINPWRDNPYWNFDYLMTLERKYGIKASYFFLAEREQGGSKYQFTESRLVELFDLLKKEGHGIGIHGTTPTAKDKHALLDEVKQLEETADITIAGGRQHRLWLEPSKTFQNHENIGLLYDSSFGFAEMEGFRNSFCLPFKPYDFENKRTIDLWQFPLMAMDVTLFSYRQLSNNSILASIESLLAEVEKHNGIFTLLWHNSFFDEVLYPGVTKTYEELIRRIAEKSSKAISGRELVELLEEKL